MCAENDEDVPNLMRRAEKVKLSREEALGNSNGVEDNSEGIVGVCSENAEEKKANDGRGDAEKPNGVEAHDERAGGHGGVKQDAKDAEDVSVEIRDAWHDEGCDREGGRVAVRKC